ncbi:MAG: serine/threonine-protein kinase, partial [Planctomycetia bacterium]
DFDTTADGLPYIVMELVDGCSLQQLISSGGPVRYDRLLPIIRETAMALQAGEEMGLVHCDVKPANILVNRRGNVKLTDYGLALAQGAKQGPSGGTVGFMSPEQFNGGVVDGLSDLFSLGVTFYYAVTGKLAFPSQTWMQYARVLLGPAPPTPHLIRPEVPKSVSDLIMEMLEREKSRRIPSFDELFDRLDLAAALAVGPPGSKPKTSGTASLWKRLMGGAANP